MSRTTYKTYLRSLGRRTPPASATARSSTHAKAGDIIITAGRKAIEVQA